jgi:hypothetical protein
MKKLILTALLSVASLAAFGQGNIIVGNAFSGSGNFIQPIFGVNSNNDMTISGNPSGYPGTLPAGGTTSFAGCALLQGSAYDFGFYAGPSTDTSISQMTLVTVLPFRTATADKLPAGLVIQAQVAVPGIDFGQQCSFAIAAWWTDGGKDQTLAQALADQPLQVGWTGVYLSPVLGGNAAFPTVPNDGVGWSSFNLVVGPEPSTFALFGIGVAGLLLFRRKSNPPDGSPARKSLG